MPNANTYLPGTLVTPGFLLITNITRAISAVVTIVTSSENTYLVGQNLYFSVPIPYKMIQIDGLTGTITNINGLNFTVNINSTMFDTFTIPSGNVTKPATVSPAGSKNLQFSNLTNQVPFRSLNNQGN